MLTKEERAEIAARFVSYDGGTLYFAELFECLFNREIPSSTTTKEDTKAVIDRLIDLCDTSNMIELPRDKDGIPFKKGDTVYESDGTEHKVDGYMFTRCDTKILSVADSIGSSYVAFQADELTHKKPVTIASITERIREIASNDDDISYCTSSELVRIADQLEKLGDSDD